MLFHWDDGMVRRSFWMKNTHIDLDIAFIGSDFVIQEIFGMEAESLDIRAPADTYQYAVEAPSGWYAANGVQAGDSARFAFDLRGFPDGVRAVGSRPALSGRMTAPDCPIGVGCVLGSPACPSPPPSPSGRGGRTGESPGC